MATKSLTTATREGLRPQEWTAEDIYAALPSDGSTKTYWVSFGVVRGKGEHFAARPMRRSPSRPRVDILRPDGDVYYAIPTDAGRTLRLLAR